MRCRALVDKVLSAFRHFLQVLELRAAVPDRHTALDAPSAVSQAASAVSVTPEGEVRQW